MVRMAHLTQDDFSKFHSAAEAIKRVGNLAKTLAEVLVELEEGMTSTSGVSERWPEGKREISHAQAKDEKIREDFLKQSVATDRRDPHARRLSY
jgi:hypothetical protein